MLPVVKQSDKLPCKYLPERNPLSSAIQHYFADQTINKRKRERTRSALLDSAISVFANKGYEATSIIDITTHAGLANGTFYNYYREKSEILADVASSLAIEITRRINDEMAQIDNAAIRVATGTARMLETAREAPEWVEVLLGSIRVIPGLQSGVVQYLRKDLEMGVEQGRFTVEINVLLINQVLALVRAAAMVDPEVTSDTISRTSEAVLRLLGVPAGRAAAIVSKVVVA